MPSQIQFAGVFRRGKGNRHNLQFTPKAACHRLDAQKGVATATMGVAEQDQELVADEFRAAFGQDRRTAGETCARYYWLLLAEGHLTRQRFGSILRSIAGLPKPDG